MNKSTTGRILVAFWVLYGAAGLIEFGMASNWDLHSTTFPQCLLLLGLFGLVFSGVMLLCNKQWARWILRVLVVVVLLVSADLCLFYLWRGRFAREFVIAAISASIALITLVHSLHCHFHPSDDK